MIKKNHVSLLIFVFLTSIITLSASQATAATLTVDDDRVQCPNAGFTTIQSAVNAASPNDRINVCPGTYREQVKVTKPLTIQGIEVGNQRLSLIMPNGVVANSTSTATGNPIAAIVLVEGTDRVTLTHLAVDGANNALGNCVTNLVGIYYRNASGTINDVAVRNIELAPALFGCQVGFGILVQSGGHERSRVEILDSNVHDYQKNGIVASEPGTEVFVSRNAVSGVGATPQIAQNGIQISFGPKGVIDNNSVINHIYSQCTAVDNCSFVATNILVFESDGVRVSGNTTGNAQVNIYYGGNRGEVQSNTILQSPVFDGIDLVGDRNRAFGNSVKNSGAEAVYVLGNGNDVIANILNEAPIGIFEDTPSSNNRFSPNDFDNTELKVVSAALAPNSLQSLTNLGSLRNTSPARP